MQITIARRWASCFLLFTCGGLLQSCEKDETAPLGSDVLLQISPTHIHTFETDVTFSASVIDPNGNPVQDFTILRVDLAQVGTVNWTKQIPLAFNGSAYSTTVKLTAPGSFDLRVVGQRPGEIAVVELYRRPQPLSAVRPHFDAGGYRVEFETDSGEYPRAEEPVALRFFIMEDVSAPQPPITGLSGVQIRCTEGSSVDAHAATESPAGTYSASHTFQAVGSVTAEVEFTGSDGGAAVATVPLLVTP